MHTAYLLILVKAIQGQEILAIKCHHLNLIDGVEQEPNPLSGTEICVRLVI